MRGALSFSERGSRFLPCQKRQSPCLCCFFSFSSNIKEQLSGSFYVFFWGEIHVTVVLLKLRRSDGRFFFRRFIGRSEVRGTSLLRQRLVANSRLPFVWGGAQAAQGELLSTRTRQLTS